MALDVHIRNNWKTIKKQILITGKYESDLIKLFNFQSNLQYVALCL